MQSLAFGASAVLPVLQKVWWVGEPFFNYFVRRGGVEEIHFRNLTTQVIHKHLTLLRPLFLGDPGSGGFREMQARDPTSKPGSGEERLKAQPCSPGFESLLCRVLAA